MHDKLRHWLFAPFLLLASTIGIRIDGPCRSFPGAGFDTLPPSPEADAMRTRVASLAEIPPGTAREVTVGERVIAIFNVAGTLYALDGICRHAGGPLAKGRLDGEVITCPWHGWQFNVTNGQHCLTPRIRADGFTVVAEGDDVFVETPDGAAP